MKNNNQNRKKNINWLFLIVGLVLLAADFGIKFFMPGTPLYYRTVGTVGVLILGWAVIGLVKYTQSKMDPEAARRMNIEETDERNLSIRNKAGYYAFIFSISLSILALLIYSYLNSGPGFDLPWFYLAAMVLIPGAVYIYCLVHFHSKY
jgi:peptidoglycan/LPS O-acetylase OafA/YrhL